MARTSKTVLRGIPKSRKGSPPIGLQTLIDRTKRAAFFGELHSKLAKSDEPHISSDVAKDSIKVLSRTPRQQIQKHLERGIVPAMLSPGIQAAGRATKALVDAKHGRWGAAGRAIKDTTKGGVVSSMLQGGGVGAGLSVSHDVLAKMRAKDTYETYLDQNKKKRRRRRRK